MWWQSKVMPEMELVDSVPAVQPAATPSPAPQEPVAAPAAEPVAPAAEPAAPATPTETPAAVEPTPALFKLPDGREVDAAGLQREYENLLPEFTRKSQELATLKAQSAPPITTEEPAWKNPDYSPKSWAEAIEIAKAEALKDLTANATAAQQAEAQTRAQVETELAQIKVSDPKVDENALFDHAVKYGFTDLKSAHANFKAMRDVALTTEQRVLKSLNTRAADPIATTPGATVAPKAQDYSPAGNGQFRGALDFLEALKANK